MMSQLEKRKISIPSSEKKALSCAKNGLRLHKDAFTGLAGEIVEAIEPVTEADPAALLVHCLSEYSAIIGNEPHLQIGSTRCPVGFNAVLVGDTSKARKGTADNDINAIFKLADPSWHRGSYTGGLSSGEGLIWAVRDGDGDKDPGVSDKRLFVVESEYGSALRIMARDGNSLSGILRNAFDGKVLAPMTKHNRLRATNHHIVVCGHVTREELLRNLQETETANGFANRFVWFLVKRSKNLPFPKAPKPTVIRLLIKELQESVEFASSLSYPISMTKNAKKLWENIYPGLSAGLPGLVGCIINRAEVQVRRIAGLYALLDCEDEVKTYHLKAALALWEYSEESVRLIFGSATGDPLGDKFLKAIQTKPGISDTDLNHLCGRNISVKQLSKSKDLLVDNRYVHCRKGRTEGRPKTRWYPGPESKEI